MKDDNLIRQLQESNKTLTKQYADAVKEISDIKSLLYSQQEFVHKLTEEKQACSKCLEEERWKNKVLYQENTEHLEKVKSATACIRYYASRMDKGRKANMWLKEYE